MQKQIDYLQSYNGRKFKIPLSSIDINNGSLNIQNQKGTINKQNKFGMNSIDLSQMCDDENSHHRSSLRDQEGNSKTLKELTDQIKSHRNFIAKHYHRSVSTPGIIQNMLIKEISKNSNQILQSNENQNNKFMTNLIQQEASNISQKIDSQISFRLNSLQQVQQQQQIQQKASVVSSNKSLLPVAGSGEDISKINNSVAQNNNDQIDMGFNQQIEVMNAKEKTSIWLSPSQMLKEPWLVEQNPYFLFKERKINKILSKENLRQKSGLRIQSHIANKIMQKREEQKIGYVPEKFINFDAFFGQDYYKKRVNQEHRRLSKLQEIQDSKYLPYWKCHAKNENNNTNQLQLQQTRSKSCPKDANNAIVNANFNQHTVKTQSTQPPPQSTLTKRVFKSEKITLRALSAMPNFSGATSNNNTQYFKLPNRRRTMFTSNGEKLENDLSFSSNPFAGQINERSLVPIKLDNTLKGILRRSNYIQRNGKVHKNINYSNLIS